MCGNGDQFVINIEIVLLLVLERPVREESILIWNED